MSCVLPGATLSRAPSGTAAGPAAASWAITQRWNSRPTSPGCITRASTAAGATDLDVAISAIDTEITGFTPGGPLDDAGEIRDYEQGLPNIRYILTARHAYGPFDLLLRYSYHGGWYNSEEALDFDGYGLLDAGVRYTLGNGVALTLGSDNLLDTYPDRNPNARRGLGNLYSQYAPAGFNGRFLYAKLAVSF